MSSQISQIPRRFTIYIIFMPAKLEWLNSGIKATKLLGISSFAEPDSNKAFKMIASFTILTLLGVFRASEALNGQLTNYCSYPPCCGSNISPPYTAAEKRYCPGNSECEDFSGCKWEGQFAYCGTKSHQWVVDNNIVALFSKHGDGAKYRNKRIRVTQGSRSIEATVCDTCADSDCDGCCSRNAGSSGYLIDMESNTMARFGGSDGPITWTCLDC